MGFVGVILLGSAYLYVGRKPSNRESTRTTANNDLKIDSTTEEDSTTKDKKLARDNSNTTDLSTSADTFPASVDGVVDVTRKGVRAGLLTYTGTLVTEDSAVRILTPVEDASYDTDVFLSAVRQWSNVSTHPNVVTVYDWDDTSSFPWVVVEASEGYRLSSLDGNLDVKEAVAIATDAAEAIRNAGLYNTRHLSLSPDVIWTSNEGQTLVGDWGLTDAIEKSNESLDVTPFTAPEQVTPNMDGSTSEATDIYRLGAISYWLFTGREPFADESDLAGAIMNSELVPPSELAPDIPPELDAPIVRAMEIDSTHRYNSAYDFKRDLNNAI